MIKKYEALVIGGGPAGLGAAAELAGYGVKTLLVDEGERPGGQLVKQTHKFFGSREHHAGIRGINIPEKFMEEIKDKIDIYKLSTVIGIYGADKRVIIYKNQKSLEEHYIPYIVIATGASENMVLLENNDLPGVFGAGAVQTLMNQYGVLPGKKVLMVGAGNIGLIVSYQLLQAGCDVAMVIEAGPKIGGYLVHSSKIIRMAIPVRTSTTIIKALGKDRVEGAVISKLDEKWQPIYGTEEEISVDTICLSVGLTPSYRLALHSGCKTVNIPELGGEVPLVDKYNESTVPGIFIAGDAGGVEEASSAMIGGRIAGLRIAQKLNKCSGEEILNKLKESHISLSKLRQGPFGDRIRLGVEKMDGEMYEQ